MHIFSTSFFLRFSAIFEDFGSILGVQKSQKIEKVELGNRPLNHYWFRAAFLMDFKALGARFWLIFGPPDDIYWLRKAIAFAESRVEHFRLKN